MSELFKIKVTEYKSYGELPNPFLRSDGSLLKEQNEWAEQRKQIYHPTERVDLALKNSL